MNRKHGRGGGLGVCQNVKTKKLFSASLFCEVKAQLIYSVKCCSHFTNLKCWKCFDSSFVSLSPAPEIWLCFGWIMHEMRCCSKKNKFFKNFAELELYKMWRMMNKEWINTEKSLYFKSVCWEHSKVMWLEKFQRLKSSTMCFIFQKNRIASRNQSSGLNRI